MKPFHKLTHDEIAGLNTESLTDSIKVGALDRGIEIPISLPEALKRSEYTGFSHVVNPVRIYCPTAGGYSDPNFGYLTLERAEEAMVGAVKIGSRYVGGKTHPQIDTESSIQIKVVVLGDIPSTIKASKLQEFSEQSSEAFDKYRDECLEKYNEVRQSNYDKAVRAEKRKEYMRLAGGNEEIAKAFYARIGHGAWPNEDGSIA